MTVDKLDRQFRCQKRDLVVTGQHVFLVGREKGKAGPNKGMMVEVVKRRLQLIDIEQVGEAGAHRAGGCSWCT